MTRAEQQHAQHPVQHVQQQHAQQPVQHVQQQHAQHNTIYNIVSPNNLIVQTGNFDFENCSN